MNASRVVVLCIRLPLLASLLAAGVQPVRADPPPPLPASEPAMSAAVFEDVPPPVAAAAAASPAADGPPPIAVVILQTPTAGEIDTGVIMPAVPAAGSGIPFADLPCQIGTRVRVLTRGQHLHRGVIEAADARHVRLRVSRRGGSASYVLRREQIQRIDAD